MNDDTISWLANETSGFSGADLLELYHTATVQRIHAKCTDPEFHMKAKAACVDTKALPALVHTLAYVTHEQWTTALDTMHASKHAINHITPPTPSLKTPETTLLDAAFNTAVDNAVNDVENDDDREEAPPHG